MSWGNLYKKLEYAIEKVEFSEFLIHITRVTGTEDRLDEVWTSRDDARSGHLRWSPLGVHRHFGVCIQWAATADTSVSGIMEKNRSRIGDALRGSEL